MSKKVVVLGLDGFNPELVDRWRDELPNLSSMMNEGMYGDLCSTVPPITPQAWTCALSGVNPGKYGFWNFGYRDEFVYGEPKLINSKEVKVDTLYDILPRYGRKVAIINVPVTYPPIEIPNGYCISCFLTPSIESQFTHPASLREEVEALVGEYIIDASTSDSNYRTMDKDRVLKRIYDMDEQRFTLMKHFIKEKNCDYLFTVIMGTDRMPHLFYRYFDEKHVYYDPDPRYKDALKNHYKYVDKNIGEIRELLDDNTVFIVHSDHSVQRLDGRINLNEWLIEEGYMKVNTYPDKLTPLRNCDIDWSQTKAWATGYTGQIYLNMRHREPQGVIEPRDYHKVLDELTEKMKAITGPNGEKLNTQVFRRTEIHPGPRSRFGPDLFMNFDECRWNISELIGYGRGVLYSHETTLGPDDGGHGQYGFFAMAGPGIPGLGKLQNLDLRDIAPTVLSIMGIEVPEDMEGNVLVKKSENGAYSEEDEDEIKKRLANLGYLG